MTYTPTPIIICSDPHADPPVVEDLNAAAWEKVNANFEDIAETIELLDGGIF